MVVLPHRPSNQNGAFLNSRAKLISADGLRRRTSPSTGARRDRWSSAYFAVLQAGIAGLSVLEWINDALMAVFLTNRSFVDEGRR
jgi:hypothetical protein